jgi:formiminotetrahydrofolate cyclodeaminase
VAIHMESGPATMAGTIILQHLGAAAAGTGLVSSLVFAATEAGPEVPAVGAGAVGAVVVAVLGMAIKSMQTTIKQLQEERAADRAQHQAERAADRARIAQLEDHILHSSGH